MRKNRVVIERDKLLQEREKRNMARFWEKLGL